MAKEKPDVKPEGGSESTGNFKSDVKLHSVTRDKYWEKNADLVSNVARYKWDYQYGQTIMINTNNGKGDKIPYSVAGVLTQKVTGIPGVSSENFTDAMNQALLALTADLRSKNTGLNAYDPIDVMKLYVAWDSIVCAEQFFRYCFGLRYTRSFLNKYDAEGLAFALDVDLDSLNDNAANLVAKHNIFAKIWSKMAVPNIYPIIDYHKSHFDHYLRDNEGDRANLYQYAPAGFYEWTEDAEHKTWELRFKRIDEYYDVTTEKLDLMQFLNGINDMYSHICNSQNYQTILADLRKIYPTDAFKFEPITDETFTDCKCILSELEAFKSHTVGIPVGSVTNLNVTEDVLAGRLRFRPTALYDSFIGAKMDKLVSTAMDSPDEKLNMAITRYTNVWRSDDNSLSDVLDTAGPMLMNDLIITRVNSNGAIIPNFENISVNGDIFVNYADESVKKAFLIAQCISDFEFHPMIRFWHSEGGKNTYLGHLFNTDNFTVYRTVDIASMNEVDILSAWDVGKVIKGSKGNNY